MSSLIHSSELKESIALMHALLGSEADIDGAAPAHVVSGSGAVPTPAATPEPVFPGDSTAMGAPIPETAAQPPVQAPAQAATPDVAIEPPEPSESLYRGDQLESCLHALCHRGGLSGAMIADDNGFAVAAYNSPVESEVFAALASVLGQTIDKAVFFLGQQDANNISLDVNYADKVVVRKFTVADSPFYLIIVCPQHIDERSEVELSIEQIKSILAIETAYAGITETEE